MLGSILKRFRKTPVPENQSVEKKGTEQNIDQLEAPRIDQFNDAIAEEVEMLILSLGFNLKRIHAIANSLPPAQREEVFIACKKIKDHALRVIEAAKRKAAE
jgi:hypothetical protein